MQKLSHNDHIDLYRHLAYCAVGGFFGCYAVLIHSGVMGNAQTVNLIELLLDALRGDLHAALLHLGALVLYVLGTMLTVLLPHWLRECDGEIDKMRDEYNMRRRLVVHGFNSMGLTCFEPRGAFYAFPCIKSTGMTSQEFCTKLLEQKHVALVPGDAFGASGEGYCRVSYAYSVEHLTEAMKRIREFLKENGINSGEQ